jgi:hypothetical protein
MGMLMMKRRRLLQLGLSTMGAAGLSVFPRQAFAQSSERKFIFVFNQGGWDPTRVFAPEFDNFGVAMEATAEPNAISNLNWVSHPERPSVDGFFESHFADTLIINGVQVRSIAHEICTCLAFTGGISGSSPDWATRIAANSQQQLAIPHLVMGGPNFAGDLGAFVVQTGQSNQLEELLDNTITNRSNTVVPSLSMPTRSLLDEYIQKRGHARADQSLYGNDYTISQAYKTSIDNAILLQNRRHTMDFTGGTFNDQIDCSLDAISKGISRCASLTYLGDGGNGWDSHANNDEIQSANFETLFSALNRLMYQMQNTVDNQGNILSENTVVVVFSEMGRTANLNGTLGKDHWPFTSVMICGKGITGDRVVGRFGSSYQGVDIDLNSAEESTGASVLSIDSVGGALLALAGLDPTNILLDSEPLLGILS